VRSGKAVGAGGHGQRAGWRLALTLAFTLALLAVLVHSFGGRRDLLEAARRARPSWVAMAFAASGACMLLSVVRWKLVLGGMGCTLPFRRALEVVLATGPLAAVTPSRTADLLRPLAVRDMVPLAIGTASVLAEKAVDLIVLLALAACGAIADGLWGFAWVIVAMLVVAVSAVGIVAGNVGRRAWLERLPVLRRRPEMVDQLFIALAALKRVGGGRIVAIAASSLAIRVLTVAVTHALLIAVGADVPWTDTLALWPTAVLVSLIPVTLGGMGTRDATFLLLLSERGTHVDDSSVLAATMGYSAVAIWAFAIVGLPFMFRETLALRRRSRTGS